MSEQRWAVGLERVRQQTMGCVEAQAFAADVEALRARLAEVEAERDEEARMKCVWREQSERQQGERDVAEARLAEVEAEKAQMASEYKGNKATVQRLRNEIGRLYSFLRQAEKERDEAKQHEAALVKYVDEAAGTESCIISIATLTEIGQRAENAEAELDRVRHEAWNQIETLKTKNEALEYEVLEIWREREEYKSKRDKLKNWQVEILVQFYQENPKLVAALCDEKLDKSGKLLGEVRIAAREINK